MKSNYDTFASRGDPWDGELSPSGRRPSGVPPRLSQEARLAVLKAERSARVAEQLKTLRHQAREHQKLEASLAVNLDHILKAGRALSFDKRIKKERNQAVAPLSAGAQPLTVSPLSSIAATRARLRKMRSLQKVK